MPADSNSHSPAQPITTLTLRLLYQLSYAQTRSFPVAPPPVPSRVQVSLGQTPVAHHENAAVSLTAFGHDSTSRGELPMSDNSH